MKKSLKPKHSLRTLLILWFLVFSLAPLAFITLFSLFKFDDVVRSLLKERLKSNSREIFQKIETIQQDLKSQTLNHSLQKELGFFLFRNDKERLTSLIEDRFFTLSTIKRVFLYDREGVLLVALEREGGQVTNRPQLETGDVRLSQEFLSSISADERQWQSMETKNKDVLELSTTVKVFTDKNRLIGYLEESVVLDKSWIMQAWDELQVSLMLLDREGRVVLSYFENKEGRKIKNIDPQKITELTHQNENFSYFWRVIPWGSGSYTLGVGSSNRAAQDFLQKMGVAFYGVVAVVFVFLLVLSFIISNFVLKPLYNLLEATQNLNLDSGKIEIAGDEKSEFGLLTKSFNEMSSRVYQSQLELRKNINMLKKANEQIKEAQTRLVQTEKMASLGQLVAGVAHELNNPIGFIHSNMTHLKEYSEDLMALVESADKDIHHLHEEMKNRDYEYIKEDLPKLIKSCEDGARRTKEIVLGLRNFSRLDEESLKDVDLHEGIENTLKLLAGELKGRIKVNKILSLSKKVSCYPGQINQVFMNLLTNAAQAIEGSGEMTIETLEENGQAVIKITDSGKGIAKEHQDKIFDPFYTTKKPGQGTGLGLSITYGIIEKHGGQIHFESQPEKGTTFIIRIPLKR